MMQNATFVWVLVACAGVCLISAIAIFVAVFLSVRSQDRHVTALQSITEQHLQFTSRLMTRFCATANMEAEAYSRMQEHREEMAKANTNQQRREADAGVQQRVVQLR